MESFGKLAVGIATLAIVLVVAFLIMAQGKAQMVTIGDINVSDTSTFTTGYNATVQLEAATSEIPTWVPIIVIQYEEIISLLLD